MLAKTGVARVVLARQVCYQTQLITWGLSCRPASCWTGGKR